jgi:hypothetical protein
MPDLKLLRRQHSQRFLALAQTCSIKAWFTDGTTVGWESEGGAGLVIAGSREGCPPRDTDRARLSLPA